MRGSLRIYSMFAGYLYRSPYPPLPTRIIKKERKESTIRSEPDALTNDGRLTTHDYGRLMVLPLYLHPSSFPPTNRPATGFNIDDYDSARLAAVRSPLLHCPHSIDSTAPISLLASIVKFEDLQWRLAGEEQREARQAMEPSQLTPIPYFKHGNFLWISL